MPRQVRDEAGPAVHAAAEAVRVVARPLLAGAYRLLCWVFGVERQGVAMLQARPAPAASVNRYAVSEVAIGADRQTDHLTIQVLNPRW